MKIANYGHTKHSNILCKCVCNSVHYPLKYRNLAGSNPSALKNASCKADDNLCSKVAKVPREKTFYDNLISLVCYMYRIKGFKRLFNLAELNVENC